MENENIKMKIFATTIYFLKKFCIKINTINNIFFNECLYIIKDLC